MIQRFELDLTTLINIITYLFFHCAAMDPKNQSQLGNSSQYNDKYGLRWQSTFLPELFLQGLDIDFITTLGTFKSTSSYSLLPWGSCELCHRNRNHNLQSVDKCSKVHNGPNHLVQRTSCRTSIGRPLDSNGRPVGFYWTSTRIL